MAEAGAVARAAHPRGRRCVPQDLGPLQSYDAVVHTPLGFLGLRLNGEGLTAIDYLLHRRANVGQPDPEARGVITELNSYFCDPNHRFTVRVALQGTAFQNRVWQALRGIPAGETLTYGELARRLGSSARAVGGACRSNPIPIIIPCHRIVSAQGLGGYTGGGSKALDFKRWLLAHEHGGRG